MAKKDYIHYKKQNSNQDKRRFPWLAILCLILLIALLISGFIYLKKVKQQRTIPDIKQVSTATVREAVAVHLTKNSQENDNPIHNQIQFDFYTMLPKMKVQMATSEDETQLPPGSTSYLLQLASFNTNEQAITFQNKLKKLGFKTKIVPATQNNTILYRIQIGPKSLTKIREIQTKLQQQNLDNILIRQMKG
jgi:cell division protein FtsN